MKEGVINNNSNIKDNLSNSGEYTKLSFIILVFIFLFQYYSKTEEIKIYMSFSNDPLKKPQINSSNHLFWKYIILSQLAQGILFFLINNIKNVSLDVYSLVIITISSFLFLILVEKMISLKNKKIEAYGFLLFFASLYSVLISFNAINLNYFIFQIFILIFELFFNIIFINNFENECNELINDIQIKNNLINNYIEKNELILIFMKVVFQFILSNINNNKYFKQIKINSPSNILCIFLSIIIIFINLYWNKKKEENNSNINKINIDSKTENKKLIIIGITDFFINIIYYFI